MLELEEKPDALKLGDGWWKIAAGLDGTAKSQAQAHAAGWYRKALPGLSGLTKARVERLVSQVPPTVVRQPVKDVAKIPKDASKWEGHHYKVFTTPMTWHDAKSFCESLGGHLVRIESEKENKYVFYLDKRGVKEVVVWIDASDDVKDGNWVYSNGKPLTFANWISIEPRRGNWNHAVVRTDKPTWHTDVGDVCRYAFVCEWDE